MADTDLNKTRRGSITALQVAKLLAAGRPKTTGCGGCLYLKVTNRDRGSWVFRYRGHEMGLGSVQILSLAEARDKALECRKLLLDGQDPMAVRKAKRAAAQIEAARSVTFKEAAEAYIKAREDHWSPKHAVSWRGSLRDHAIPILGDLAVQTIDTGLILRVLEPIWSTKSETAGRLRGRIEAILDWSAARGFRQGDNPARWRGALQYALPVRSKLHRVKHMGAMAFDELPGFVQELRLLDTTVARALRALILTATRTGELLGARWDEINMTEQVWEIPAERMKMAKPHRIPLSAAAMAIVEAQALVRENDLVFAGRLWRAPLGASSMWRLLCDLRPGTGLTCHGFRSTFADWAAERTNYPYEVRELALAHQIHSAVVRSYQRSDLFDRRRRLMEEWGKFCTADPGRVVALR